MRSSLSIGWRAGLAAALVLAVLLVPLAHSAHYHDGGSDRDASMNATCVICKVAGGHVAAPVSGMDFTVAVHRQTVTGGDTLLAVPAALHLVCPSRAPPLSLI